MSFDDKSMIEPVAGMKHLMWSQVFTDENIEESLKYLAGKKDSSGKDGVMLSDLPEYWELNQDRILGALEDGTYRPGIVTFCEIVNYRGKKRTIALYNSVDRLLLRCLMQMLQVAYDSLLSDHCYAFREGYGVTEAVNAAAGYLESNYQWTASVDIEKYFDNIDLSRMEKILEEVIEDEKIRLLIDRYLHVMVETEGIVRETEKGLIQGSPCSPFMSNLYLMGLDQMLEKKGIRYCRYSDDICLFFRKKEEAEQGYQWLKDYLKAEYDLSVNSSKSGIFYGVDQQYLGYRFEYDKKTKHITAVRKKKPISQNFHTWNRSCIERIDRTYHVVNDGILTKRDYNILFENENGKKYIPVETTQALNIHSNVIFSGEFFRYLNRKRINVQLFDKYGNSVGYFLTSENGYRTRTMMKQVEIYQNPVRRLEVAKAMEIAALHNLRANLRYYSKGKTSSETSGALNEAIVQLSDYITQVNQAKTVDEMLLVEGRARQLYYQMFNEICRNEDFRFVKRTRQPPQDPLNSMISFGNVYLYSRFATEIGKTSLDIRIGFVHSATYRNQTLNLDLADIYKPIVIDRVIFSMINKGMIKKERHFESGPEGGVYLNKVGKRLFIEELDQKIYQKLTIGNETKSYDTRIREEVRNLLRFVLHGEKYKPYKYY